MLINMYPLLMFIVAAVITPGFAGSYQDEALLYAKFPKDFAWSVATAAYQIEGGWNADGKGMSIWDNFTHQPGRVEDNSNGDIACDSYNRWKEDIEALKKIGTTHYRFSLAWTRILPNGTGEVNQAGIKYYRNLIEGLLAADIKPMVTLYHWDLPQVLEDQGGWLNEAISDWFMEYAAIVFKEFGHHVKIWITVNEPYVTCIHGYGYGTYAPGRKGIEANPYICAHNTLKAHAKVYRMYHRKFAASQNGKVGIALNTDSIFPLTSSPADVEAAERELRFYFGWFAHPILIGDYPPVVIERVAKKSAAQGFNVSRLPSFTQKEKALIFNSTDFLGLNHYTARIIKNDDKNVSEISVIADRDTAQSADTVWPTSGSWWLRPVAKGFRRILNWIKHEYGNIPIYVTENGYSDRAGNLDDMARIYYLKHYINQMLKAIVLDGIDIRGYTVWTLMDNFEWAVGFSEKFGLFSLDPNDPQRKRVMKSSAVYYRQIIRDNGFVESTCPYYDVLSATPLPGAAVAGVTGQNGNDVTFREGSTTHENNEARAAGSNPEEPSFSTVVEIPVAAENHRGRAIGRRHAAEPHQEAFVSGSRGSRAGDRERWTVWMRVNPMEKGRS